MKEFKIVVVEPFEAQEEETSSTTSTTTDQTTTAQDTTTSTTSANSSSTDTSTSSDTTGSDSTSSTDTATTQGASSTNTSSSDSEATTQTTTWETLGTKTFTITAEVPTCGIKVNSWSIQLLKNGSPISSGATVTTNDNISVKATFTVSPASSGCQGSGAVGMVVKLDGTQKGFPSTNISGLTSQKTYTVTFNLGKLSAGTHTISVTAEYIPGPLST